MRIFFGSFFVLFLILTLQSCDSDDPPFESAVINTHFPVAISDPLRLPGSFLEVQSTSTSHFPQDFGSVQYVLSGDVLGGTGLELVLFGSTSILVLEPTGDVRAVIYPSGRVVVPAILTDFDSDGKEDIVVGSVTHGPMIEIFNGRGKRLHAFRITGPDRDFSVLLPVDCIDDDILILARESWIRAARGVFRYNPHTSAERWYFRIPTGLLGVVQISGTRRWVVQTATQANGEYNQFGLDGSITRFGYDARFSRLILNETGTVIRDDLLSGIPDTSGLSGQGWFIPDSDDQCLLFNVPFSKDEELDDANAGLYSVSSESVTPLSGSIAGEITGITVVAGGDLITLVTEEDGESGPRVRVVTGTIQDGTFSSMHWFVSPADVVAGPFLFDDSENLMEILVTDGSIEVVNSRGESVLSIRGPAAPVSAFAVLDKNSLVFGAIGSTIVSHRVSIQPATN